MAESFKNIEGPTREEKLEAIKQGEDQLEKIDTELRQLADETQTPENRKRIDDRIEELTNEKGALISTLEAARSQI